jgi:hypothetical protein
MLDAARSMHWPRGRDVLGDNGREVEICQRTVEIDATSEGEATELAKQRFCKAEQLRERSLHADRIKIKPAELSVFRGLIPAKEEHGQAETHT